MLDSIIANTRQHIAAHIKLVAQEPDMAHPHGLLVVVMDTPVGQLRGSPSPSVPSASKYIGICLRPKVVRRGEPQPEIASAAAAV